MCLTLSLTRSLSDSQSKNVWGEYTKAEILKSRDTYAMCVETDFLMGQVHSALMATGQYDDAYITFLSDHGEMNMEHRQDWIPYIDLVINHINT